MHLMEQGTRAAAGLRIEAFLVDGGEFGDGSDAAAAVTLSEGRVLARAGADEAVERIAAMAAKPVILIDAVQLSDEALAGLLSGLDGLAAGRDLPIVAGINKAQIDIAAAGLALSRHAILCDPRPADWIAALVTADGADALALHDRVGTGRRDGWRS